MSYLQLAKKAKEEYRLKQQNSADLKPSAVEQIIDDTVVAVLIDSEVLGAPIWFALRDGWKPEEADSIPVFYASELLVLKTKTPAELRRIFGVKAAFGGGIDRK